MGEGGPYMVLSKGGFGDGPHHSCMAFFGGMEERNVVLKKSNAVVCNECGTYVLNFHVCFPKKIISNKALWLCHVCYPNQ